MARLKLRYVIAYDIPDDRRRRRVARVLDDFGDRVQYSVFEAVLDQPLVQRLLAILRDEIDPRADRVRLYALCAACGQRITRLGVGADLPLHGTETVFIV